MASLPDSKFMKISHGSMLKADCNENYFLNVSESTSCFFSSITTLFKPFISFIVISLICICYFIFVANLDSIISTTVNKGIINFAEPLFAVVSSVIFYFASTIILRLKRSDMKTTSIS